jgi:hypothetical protein
MTVLALLIVLAGAAGAGAPDTVPATPYFPLQVGNVWHYRAGENQFTLRVTRHEKIGGVMCARVEMVMNKKKVADEHLGVGADGLARYAVAGKEVKPPILLLKLPVKDGNTWKVESKFDGKLLRGSFTEGSAEVKVPAGKYQAVTVTAADLEVDGVKMGLTYYFAENVGMVKQAIDLAGQKILVELEKFDKAGAKKAP